jgi:membrane dipeptidase
MVRHSEPEAATRDRAAALHERAVVVNGLGGGKALVQTPAGTEFLLPGIMRAGGVTAVNFTVSFRDGFAVTIQNLSRLLRAIDEAEDARVAYGVQDILDAHAAGGAAVVLGLQNADPIEGTLEYLDVLHRLGLRVVQLTYQRRNLVADGCGEPANAGLSLFGRRLVDELNRLGILIDVSHVGQRSTLETVELSRAPVAITHACVYARNPVPRNKTDEEIRAVAERGGVMGINAVARLISPEGRKRGATLAEFLDQIDYVVDLVGVDHVGIGLDISEGMTEQDFEARKVGFLAEFPELGGDFAFEHYYTTGLDSMAKAGLITEGLVDRGYSDEDVLKILGGNFLRVFEAAWRPC